MAKFSHVKIIVKMYLSMVLLDHVRTCTMKFQEKVDFVSYHAGEKYTGFVHSGHDAVAKNICL